MITTYLRRLQQSGRLALLLMSIFTLSILAVPHAAVSAVGLGGVACEGLATATGEDCGDPGAAGDSIAEVVQTAINVLSIIVGIIAVFMIIIAGIRYVTGGGDPGSVKGARDTIIYAIVGLIIAGAAQAIIRIFSAIIG